MNQHTLYKWVSFRSAATDRDPNWDKLKILHAWGGRANPGIYSVACAAHGVTPLTYDQATRLASKPVFEFICEDLLAKAAINPIFDYVFVDEGQDFPPSFVRLAHALAKNQRIVLAYDELQTIFQTTAPSMADIFGVDVDGKPRVELVEDTVLHTCYRNPLEILVCAHAMGFGIYGKKIVQMLENRDHWSDLGYEVENDELRAGQNTRILRPREHSPSSISLESSLDDILVANSYTGIEVEISAVAKSIQRDIEEDGLQPDDILVIAADDRNAKAYLSSIGKKLSGAHIRVNNMQEDSYGIRDFVEAGAVTLATVHKAKGNEAYMVYVLGIDALFAYPSVRARNMIFTAMTRAKAWLRITGVGPTAKAFVEELNHAKSKLPYLEFVYPSEADIHLMRRDLQETPEQRMDRALEDLEHELPAEELVKVLEQKLRTLRGVRRGTTKVRQESKRK